MHTCAFLACAGALLSLSYNAAPRQESVPPSPSTATDQQPASTTADAASSSKVGKQKYSHANDFVIRGTVFTDKALAFPGAELRVRRAGDKKYKVRDYTNSRGEFAIRVPQGFDYEMLVHAKGFADQTQTIDAKNGPVGNNLAFRMQRIRGEKK
jgi:hypothetical protein